MKKLLLLFCFGFLYCPVLSAQSANSLRVGGGFTLTGADEYASDNKHVIGPKIYVEYERRLNPYFALDFTVNTDQINYGKQCELFAWNIGLRGMVTPLPEKFRFIKFGAGGGYSHETFMHPYGEGDPTIMSLHRSVFGFDFTARAYVIDSRRYELFAAFEPICRFIDSKLRWGHDNVMVVFGVKF